MSSLLPLAAYNLAVEPYVPVQAIESEMPVTVRITLAAIDPENVNDDDEQPSTLRILKASPLNRLALDSDDEDSDLEGESDSESGSDSEGDESAEDEEMDADEDAEEGSEEGSEDEDDDEEFDDDDVEEYVVCTLSPKSQYQQTLDITISPEEEIFFVVTGSYPVHISGNYIDHPFDSNADDFDSDEFDSEDEDDEDFDSDEYDLTPDEEELAEGDFDINDLEDEEDVEGKIEELVEEDEKKQSKKESKKESKKDNKKRQAEEETKPEVKETKKQKKAREQEEKKVQFNKELEQGPTKTEEKKKPAVQTLAGGVVIEDRTIGKGPQAKAGNKVGVRYIGKLKNGSVFDKNTSGKPFQFALGKGEVIKGWDIGVAGMAVGGERRIVIPAPFAYGKKKLPGIPANSELTFDVKLVSLK